MHAHQCGLLEKHGTLMILLMILRSSPAQTPSILRIEGDSSREHSSEFWRAHCVLTSKMRPSTVARQPLAPRQLVPSTSKHCTVPHRAYPTRAGQPTFIQHRGSSVTAETPWRPAAKWSQLRAVGVEAPPRPVFTVVHL